MKQKNQGVRIIIKKNLGKKSYCYDEPWLKEIELTQEEYLK